MRLGFFAPVLAATVLASLAASHEARACGACVVPPSENTVVTGHRMALSVSPTQTVLWDQIKYDGNPADFGWVLPVKPGAVVELSTDAWFETLDATTTAQITAPPVNCGGGGSSFGCGSFAAAEDARDFGGSEGPSVDVLHRGTIGPYETVTLSTKVPGALNAWLDKAGYTVPAESQPVVDAYVKEGFDFIALKLKPGKDVQEMKPVRVVQPGAAPTLPLRMVAIGTGTHVAITLFVISEGRWAAKNFGNATTPLDLLSWDFKANSSNYGELRDELLAQNGGATWLTAFAMQNALLLQIDGQGNMGFGGPRNYSADGQSFVDTIAAAYVQRGLVNGEEVSDTCTMNFSNIAGSGNLVVNPCPPGKPAGDPSCEAVSAPNIDARQLACGKLDDLSVAFNGLHPKDVWLTRLEANLPRAALGQDLLVEPAKAQTPVDNQMQARGATNVDAFCPSGVAPVSVGKDGGGSGRRGPLTVAVGLLGAALLLVSRRRLRRALA